MRKSQKKLKSPSHAFARLRLHHLFFIHRSSFIIHHLPTPPSPSLPAKLSLITDSQNSLCPPLRFSAPFAFLSFFLGSLFSKVSSLTIYHSPGARNSQPEICSSSILQ